LREKQRHWRDLNSSLLRGSPLPNQLDHGGHLGFNEVYSSLYIQFLKIQGMDLAGSTQGLSWGHQKRSLRGPPHMDHIWRGPHTDLGNRGHYGKVHAKTLSIFN
jgi:hypothetical protein